MDATAPLHQERSELERVLQSGIFDKCPRLETFFRYVCDRYFEGRSDEIKEYSIAIEALGRSADFDPKKDSIVRVEAHRLRKRLEEYYRGAGANGPVRIVIPNGQYRPQFVLRPAGERVLAPEVEVFTAAATDAAPLALLPVNELRTFEPRPSVTGSRWQPRYGAAAAVILVVAVVLMTAVFLRSRQLGAAAPGRSAEPEIWKGKPADPLPTEMRILAGYHGAAFTDRQGHTWTADMYFNGGQSAAVNPDHLIEAQPDPHLLKAQRSGQFRYDIPVRRGSYELHLYFAETEYGEGNARGGGDGTRMFRVSINSAVALPSFDPLAEAGGANRLHERVFKDVAPAADGKLHLQFDPLTGQAFLNAIELVPSQPGRIHPVRIVAQTSPVTDSDGRLWAADEYVCGGTQVFRRNMVFSAPEKILYQGERYGNFAYHIPVAPGRYLVTLHFAETWFGSPESNEPAAGQRVFNVFANGIALLRNFEIAREAGGPNRSVVKTFRGVEANAQGILRLEFVPVRNYAEVNAIEVVEVD